MPWFARLRTGDDKGTDHLGLSQRVNEIIGVKNLAQCLVHSECIMYGSFYSGLLGFISYPCYESLDDSRETQTLLSLFMSFTYLFSLCYGATLRAMTIILHFDLKGMRRS